jgi:hypothetical protein
VFEWSTPSPPARPSAPGGGRSLEAMGRLATGVKSLEETSQEPVPSLQPVPM